MGSERYCKGLYWLVDRLLAGGRVMSKPPTKQRKPSFGKNGVPTPPGFEAHPERRHNGAWKKEDTPRYKLEQMMKLKPSELDDVIANPDAPLFEHKLAIAIKKGSWNEIERMISQVYGTPKQTQDITTGGDKIQPLMVKFLDDDAKD